MLRTFIYDPLVEWQRIKGRESLAEASKNKETGEVTNEEVSIIVSKELCRGVRTAQNYKLPLSHTKCLQNTKLKISSKGKTPQSGFSKTQSDKIEIAIHFDPAHLQSKTHIFTFRAVVEQF